MIAPIFENGQLYANNIKKTEKYSILLGFAEKMVYLP